MRAVVVAAVVLTLATDLAGASQLPPLSQHFRSRPDLVPPTVNVRTRTRNTTPGYIFLAPKRHVTQAGPLIIDDAGNVVWFKPLDTKGVTDFRVQRFRGQPVLTWWRGRAPPHAKDGYYVIYDSSYRKITDVQAGNGLVGDIHEFRITPRDTALITIYHRRHADLRPVGGRKDGEIYEGVVQEVDIATGRVLFEWHSFPQVGVKESYWPIVPKNGPYDYFHINAVDQEPNGNLLVSSRNTHALYEIDRATRKIVWRLGGKHSDFAIARSARFEWQHDARRQPDGTITVFDNGSWPRVEKYSRVLVLRVDEATHRVTLVRSYRHPRRLSSNWEGNAQFLPNGHVFVGWGSNPDFTEFDEHGRVVLDGSFGRQGRAPQTEADSYRAYRFVWTGHPTDRPSVAVSGHRLYVSWNGATEVRQWQVLAGPSGQALRPWRTVPKRAFETAVALPPSARVVAARALDGAGNVLGTSRAVKR